MEKIKKIIWLLILGMLWIPMIQAFINFVEVPPLKGAFTNNPKPKLTDSLWFDGSFQKNYELYINDSIGFHNDFIRLRNQLDFSLFNKCHSFDIEIGKNGYLVATTHVDAALGKTRISDSTIDTTVFMLNRINDTLSKLNKTLIVMLAPNRGNYLQEHTPSWYNLVQTGESDHARYSKKLAKTNINTIDVDQWFLKLKGVTKYPLFTKIGIHWSNYAAVVASDSLIKLIESERKIDMPDLTINKIELSDSPKPPDGDLNEALNLIYPVKSDTLAYPVIKFNSNNKTRPNALIIGDSFFFNITCQGIPQEAFNESSFWYYNKTIFTTGVNNGKSVSDVSLKEEINKHDVIIIISTDITLPNIGWGFIKNTYDAFYNSKEIEYYKQKIRNDAAWYATVVEKAKVKKISIEEQLLGDALYAMSLEKK